jgi:hypothetical protein
MSPKDKAMLITAIALVLIGIFYSYVTFLEEKLPKIYKGITSNEQSTENQGIVPPPATGNVDDAANAILKELSDEDPILTEEESDTLLITNDSQEIGDFGQLINESEL